MKKLKNTIGMTVAELLLVVAIIGVLGGVAVVAVINHQRSLGQLERDGIAKEIFIAAQNHLTMAYGEGYLGLEEPAQRDDPTNPFGTPEDKTAEHPIYYIVYPGTSRDNTSALGQMLPFGSLDETVLTGGSYIIRYQKDTGLVLDVFYCSMGSGRFDHELKASEYETVLDLKGEDKKPDRRNWNSKILGWYGADGAELAWKTLKAPTVKITNAETLYVTVTDLNPGDGDVYIKLIIEGLSSGAKKAFSLKDDSSGRVTSPDTGKYNVILDDITAEDLHFAELTADVESFIPGENITIRAVTSSRSQALANVAYSVTRTTNSLFADLDDKNAADSFQTALVDNIRHLENLDACVSNLNDAPTVQEGFEKYRITGARQTGDLDWVEFMEKTGGDETQILFSADAGTFYSAAEATKEGCYYPVSPDYSLDYDGQSNSITNVKVEWDGDAGLFGRLGKELEPVVINIENLELIDFSVTGTTSAGALVGSLAYAGAGSGVTNVLVRNSDSDKDATFGNINGKSPNVKATGATSAAGGLIGESGASAVSACAAAVYVKGEDAVGGLIGCAGNNGTVKVSYSAGHTTDGSYSERIKTNGYDVSGKTVGGLIGIAGGAKITGSYSTCSVSGTTAGGLAGSAAAAIKDSYATGLVTGTGSQFAFLGSGALPAGSTGNYYYRAINEVEVPGINGKTVKEPMLPVSGYALTADMAKIKPLDLNAEAYNEFTGKPDTWGEAKPYDAPLLKYFYGSYCLQNVRELYPAYFYNTEKGWETFFACTHYGDWPSPEVFFINTF